MFRPLLVLVACVAAVAIGGCNTVKGMGQDIQKAGHAIENAAR